MHNVAVVGGWGSNDYGARLSCGANSLGCGLDSEHLVAGFVGSPLPTGWVKHESRDTCIESFDVEYLWTWFRPNLCGPGAVQKHCKGKFRVSCNRCGTGAGYIAPSWTDSPAIIGYAGTQTLTIANGLAPYTYTLAFTDQQSGGDANFTDNGKWLKTDSKTISVTTDDLCGYVEITVVDDCRNSPEGKGTLLAGDTGSYTTTDCDECYTCSGLDCCSGSRQNAGPTSYWSASIGAVAENGIYQGSDEIEHYIGLRCDDSRCDNYCRENVGTSDGWSWYVAEFDLEGKGLYCAYYPAHDTYDCYQNSNAALKRWLCTG